MIGQLNELLDKLDDLYRDTVCAYGYVHADAAPEIAQIHGEIQELFYKLLKEKSNAN